MATAYQLTRPPELVWWRSPEIGNSGRHTRILVPHGWELQLPLDAGTQTKTEWQAYYRYDLIDRRPRILRRFFPASTERCGMTIITLQSVRRQQYGVSTEIHVNNSGRGVPIVAQRRVISGDITLVAEAYYEREDHGAFNRTYKQICNSLTIE